MKRRDFKTTKQKAIETIIEQNTVPVLYQNIGGEVYAFAQVGDEVYFGKVPVQSKAVSAVELEKQKDAV